MENEQLVQLTADIVAAHVANNNVAVGDVGNLVQRVYEALSGLEKPSTESQQEEKTPVVSVRASIKPDYIVCMECGAKQRMLKRHLMTAHQMTPEQYRTDYALPREYPMVAPNYSEQRRALAHSIGLGRKKGGDGTPTSDGTKGATRGRGRPRKAAADARSASDEERDACSSRSGRLFRFRGRVDDPGGALMTRADTFDAIIIGAGGAGLMCAAVAGQRGLKVLLLDHADEPGKKILISGGGRCNFTNVNAAADRYLSSNPHFAKSALGRYQPQEFIALVDRYGIAWHEKTLGQLFCDGSARQIVAMLLEECEMGAVELRLGRGIGAIDHADGQFRVANGEREVRAAALVVASGGPSIPKLGATGFAYDLARRFGLKVVEPRPALVPLTLSGEEALFRSLSGVSAEVIAKAGKARFREAALFTHKGLSGPAILQISSYWRRGEPLGIDFFPDDEPDWLVEDKRVRPRASLRTALSRRLPERLADTLAERLGLSGELANLSDRLLTEAARRLGDWTFMPNGTEGFAKAEVTLGGIATDGLSSRTMEASRVPGLYAIGEAVDVTGWLGGYNFQWAWASGWAAGQALPRRI